MRSLTYYIASTIDGFIAGPDGQFDFFPFEGDVAAAILAEYPETIPIHARKPPGLTGVANQQFDTVLMGRGTYEPALAIGITSPYPYLRQYVFSRTLAGADPKVRIVAGDPVGFVRRLKPVARSDRRLVIKRHPIGIGSGIPLFDCPFEPTRFDLAAARTFNTGVQFLTYIRS